MNKQDRKRLAKLELQNQQTRKAVLIMAEWMLQHDPAVRRLTGALGVSFALVEGSLKP